MNPGKKIAQRRQELGMTQQELADAVFVSRPMITQIERGTKAVTLQLANEIASVLKIDIGALLS